MSTLRITNIEAKADPSSPTVDEKIKLTNSNGDILVHIDGKTSGITTIGINTTAGNIKFDQNSNVVVTGIITATKFVGTIEPTTLTVGGDLTIPDKIVHTGDTNTAIRFPAADTITAETGGSERLRIDSGGDIIVGVFTPVDTRNTGGLHIQANKGISFKSHSTAASRNWRIRNDDYAWGNLDFSVGDSVNDWGDSAADVLLSLTSNRRVGINQITPQTTFHSTGTTNGQQATFGIDNSGLKISTFQKTDNDAGVILDAQQSSNGTLTLATAGTERFRITSTGKIGFNATNPPRDYCFHSGQADTNIQITNNTTGIDDSAGSLIQQDGNDLYIWNKENSFMSLGTNAAERVRISSAGDATFKYKVTIGSSYAGGEILSLGKSSGTSYVAFHNGGANMGFIGYADQLIAGGASNELGIRSQDEIRFATGGNTERFRISDSVITCATGVGMAIDSGTSSQPTDSALLVTKQNNNDWAFQVRNYEGTSTDYGFYSRSKNTADYAIGVYDADNSSWRFRVNGAGRIYATNTTVSSISDQRLKENIVDANSQWDDIKALRFRNFNWREDSGFSDGRTYLGLIAQEVEPISPNLVDINAQSKEDVENEVPDPEYKNVKYSIVWMKAVKALQEAQTRIETLETQLTDALARITALEG